MKISIPLVHEIFGHMGEDRMREISKYLWYELTRGSLQTCEACATGKANQKIYKGNQTCASYKEI